MNCQDAPKAKSLAHVRIGTKDPAYTPTAKLSDSSFTKPSAGSIKTLLPRQKKQPAAISKNKVPLLLEPKEREGRSVCTQLATLQIVKAPLNPVRWVGLL